MKKIFNFFLLMTAITSLSSCLKDEVMIGPDAPGAISNVIEFANIGAIQSGTSAPTPLYIPFTLKPTATTASFEGIVNYAGADVAPSDITVTIAADAALITNYNAKVTGSTLVQLPASSYTLPTTVVIPKGQRQAKFTVTVKPNTFDATKSNALAIKIVSASTGVISGNFGANIYSMPLESIWQGTYTVTYNNNYGTLDANIAPYSPFTTPGIQLKTIGPNLLRSENVSDTYGGFQTWQFNGSNTTISAVTTFTGSDRATSIQGVDLIDPVNLKFTIRYTWLGRGMTEQWVRTGPLL